MDNKYLVSTQRGSDSSNLIFLVEIHPNVGKVLEVNDIMAFASRLGFDYKNYDFYFGGTYLDHFDSNKDYDFMLLFVEPENVTCMSITCKNAEAVSGLKKLLKEISELDYMDSVKFDTRTKK
ncbi:hypothetical protein COV20_03230 [Candidatus Woesearchaeota archaeon CG10_big_fil_rev_8_21_14_0_10_45_16]|nr:MAG: hypothetical protein COV20_03230 [Candidatus Woesearchaeota archaeon CG10_big_fil_rev_8_21_14_0_10_45_16]